MGPPPLPPPSVSLPALWPSPPGFVPVTRTRVPSALATFLHTVGPACSICPWLLPQPQETSSCPKHRAQGTKDNNTPPSDAKCHSGRAPGKAFQALPSRPRPSPHPVRTPYLHFSLVRLPSLVRGIVGSHSSLRTSSGVRPGYSGCLGVSGQSTSPCRTSVCSAVKWVPHATLLKGQLWGISEEMPVKFFVRAWHRRTTERRLPPMTSTAGTRACPNLPAPRGIPHTMGVPQPWVRWVCECVSALAEVICSLSTWSKCCLSVRACCSDAQGAGRASPRQLRITLRPWPGTCVPSTCIRQRPVFWGDCGRCRMVS